jgi:8-oxo-dGTP diphosphatase
MTYTPILGSLGFVMSADRKRVLLVHRTARPEDDQLGKYNGLGGKMKPGEDVVGCMRRELREEAGIEGVSMLLRGTVNWTNFGPNGEDWLGFIFRIDEFSGELLRENAEGTLDWYRIDELERLDMWEGDRHFLPLVFDDDPRMFHGYMPYDRERPLSWSFERL